MKVLSELLKPAVKRTFEIVSMLLQIGWFSLFLVGPLALSVFFFFYGVLSLGVIMLAVQIFMWNLFVGATG